MAKLPRPTGTDMVKFLQQEGMTVMRVRGSHHYMAGGGRRTTVPVHGSRTLKLGTLRSILRDIDLSPAEFERRWRG